jgi:hypothetical protein
MLIQMVSINVKGEYAAEFLEAFRINYEGTSREPGAGSRETFALTSCAIQMTTTALSSTRYSSRRKR